MSDNGIDKIREEYNEAYLRQYRGKRIAKLIIGISLLVLAGGIVLFACIIN